jgi:hypothetical protein
MNKMIENLESTLFCVIQVNEYYLHQMLNTNIPLRAPTFGVPRHTTVNIIGHGM